MLRSARFETRSTFRPRRVESLPFHCEVLHQINTGLREAAEFGDLSFGQLDTGG